MLTDAVILVAGEIERGVALNYDPRKMDDLRPRPRLAKRGWAGLFLVAACWPLDWTLPGLRTAYLFFPLWLGYILFVDALVCRRAGSSLWTRQRGAFRRLFILSAPAWWLFECINWRTGNWEYLGAGSFNPVEYAALCTLSFSTVMPAVFETAELARTFRWLDAMPGGPKLPPTPRAWFGLFISGLLMLALLLLWPQWFYPLTWISLWLTLEPVNRWLGRRHLLGRVAQGDWRPIVSLSAGALICGFFWEMW
ncbi:MAG TPA: hypothetical protein VL970_06635, partial [Candidatus Acidoferrales bacterium]|nr:hypothetical protein [Candidatus Acidoferrales bacterium]